MVWPGSPFKKQRKCTTTTWQPEGGAEPLHVFFFKQKQNGSSSYRFIYSVPQSIALALGGGKLSYKQIDVAPTLRVRGVARLNAVIVDDSIVSQKYKEDTKQLAVRSPEYKIPFQLFAGSRLKILVSAESTPQKSCAGSSREYIG